MSSFCSSLSVAAHVSAPQVRIGLIYVKYNLNLIFLVSNFEVNNFLFLWYVALPFFILSLISAIMLLFSVRTEPRYVNLDIPSNLYSPIFNSYIVLAHI
jgi:hypothetical protein